MEHFIGMAFWIFTLSVTLSGCHPIPKSEFDIFLLQNEVICPNDSIFYSPESPTTECFTSALECVFKELNVTAKLECEDNSTRIDQALETLDELIAQKKSSTSSVSTNSNNCACEKWPETSFDKFLKNYEELIERINSQ